MENFGQTIIVVLAADDNYAMPLAVTICSILMNMDNDQKIRLIILDGGIEGVNKEKIYNVFETHRNKEKHELKWLNPELKNLRGLPTSRLPKSAYLPLLIPSLLSSDCKRAIYLDCDLIVEKDIKELWNYNYKDGTILCATRDLIVQTLSHPEGVKKFKEMGGSSDSPYFNSGVMLMDLVEWRKNNITKKVMDYLNEYKDLVFHHDQDALNAVLIDRWEELDPRWNQQGCIHWPQVLPDSQFSKKVLELYDELVNSPFIIHFLSKSKPWTYKSMHPSTYKFLYYLRESGWFSTLEWHYWRLSNYYKRFRWLSKDLINTLQLIKITKP